MSDILLLGGIILLCILCGYFCFRDIRDIYKEGRTFQGSQLTSATQWVGQEALSLVTTDEEKRQAFANAIIEEANRTEYTALNAWLCQAYEGHINDVAISPTVLTPDEILFRDQEKKARELFKALQPEAYAEYVLSRFEKIRTESQLFPIQYTIYREGIWVNDGRSSDRICITPERHIENPDTDNILQLYLMLKWDEAYVLRKGNWWGIPLLKAWLILCKRYPFHALRYYVLRLSRKVLAVLSFCTGGRR